MVTVDWLPLVPDLGESFVKGETENTIPFVGYKFEFYERVNTVSV